MSEWIINPELGFVETLAQYGRFLESDYRMIIEHLSVPPVFEEYTEKTNRKFVIVGGNDTPWILPKSVYLCLKLAGPESVIVRTPHLDENFMVQNVFDYHAKNVRTRVFAHGFDELQLDEEWVKEVENATDIIVFGDQKAMEAYREYETVDRRVWEHGTKFSFGIIREEHLTPININNVCFDFFSFYGEGSLSPKFYFVLGKLRRKAVNSFNQNMAALYSPIIQEYRSKLPFTRKSELVQKVITSNYADHYVRYDNIRSNEIFDNLYGDVKLVPVEDLDEIEDFIREWSNQINTVAINMDDDTLTLDMLEDMMVMRICKIGDMQFPDFFEQYDSVDDFNIYVDEE